jgi:glyoxylase-like metal-dependent hydrolase (beta-lactamase superfamily II)
MKEMTRFTPASVRGSWVLALAVAAFMGAYAHTSAQNGRGGGSRPAEAPVAALHVQGNVWMLASRSGNAAVQVGGDGVLVVDTMTADLADDLLAEIRRLAGDRPIRYVVNTHAHVDHVGGNEKIAAAGRSIVSGNFAGDIGRESANYATVVSHENVLSRLTKLSAAGPPIPPRALATSTFFGGHKDLYFNGEGVQLIHVPSAHTDGDVMVHFRGSDVVVAGDLFVTTTFPSIDGAAGGDLKGVLAGLNRIIDIAIPRDKQEGGTYVIPGHGRLSDEADVVDYRDMVTVVRDRVMDAVGKKMTSAQIRAARLTRDYDSRYAGPDGSAAARFIDAAERSIREASAPGPAVRQPSGGRK